MKQLIGLFFSSFILLNVTVSFGEDKPQVSLRGQALTLLGTPIHVGLPLPDVSLSDRSLKMISMAAFKGKVTLISVVPSLDTPTCDKQTHILSEENGGLDQSMNLVTISRDLPFAQKRFAKKAKMGNILFLSDYREGRFGTSTGLMIDENRLLTRAIIILDKEGIVRYLEIVPELAKLPNMQKAFDFAKSL